MPVSNGLAILSLLVSVLSVIYANRAWRKACQANNLAVHHSRVEIHGALSDLRQLMNTKGVRIQESDVAQFVRPLEKEAQFYFANPETSKKVNEYFDICFKLAGCGRKLDRPNNSQAQIAEIQREQDVLSSSEQSLYAEAERRVAEELRAAVKPGSGVV